MYFLPPIRRAVPLVAVYAAVLTLFYRGLFNFYFQDDFIHLSLGWIRSVSDLPALFSVIEHFPYRPLAIQAAGFVAVHLFRLDPFPAHLQLFLLHGVTIALLWKALDDFVTDRRGKFVITFLYAIHSSHFMLLYWWSIQYMLLGSIWFLLTVLILRAYEKTGAPRYILLYGLGLFLMFLTNESLLVYPVWLAAYAYLYGKKKIRKFVWPTAAFTILFAAARLSLGRYPLSEDYRIGSAAEMIKTAQWYLFRAVNLPEGVDHMSSTDKYALAVLFVGICGISLFHLLGNRHWKNRTAMKGALFGLSWFVIVAGPFFLLPQHLSAYYLHTALMGLFIGAYKLGILAPEKRNGLCRFTAALVPALFLLVSYGSVSFMHKTHWAVWRADIARRYVEKTKQLYPVLEKGRPVVFTRTAVVPSEIAVVLSGDKALRLYYDDPELQVYFQDRYTAAGAYVVSDE